MKVEQTTRREKDLLIDYEDALLEKQIYSSELPKYICIGALAGAIVLGVISWLIASGTWLISYLGQFSASGDGVATATGAGAGVAIGGLIGGLIVLMRLYRSNHELH